MEGDSAISVLMFFTLAGAVVVGGGSFISFLRSRHNRYIAEQALVGDGKSRPGLAPEGALPELVGVLLIGLIVMALLFSGYALR